MKRIGIVTIVDNRNFGNRLQNFALQESVKSFGAVRVETFQNRLPPLTGLELVRLRALSIRESGLASIPHRLGRRLSRPSTEPNLAMRHQALAGFTSKYIELHSNQEKSFADFKTMAQSFDAMVVGSDQVWNPNYKMGTWIDFLKFADETKRIAYAASFGVDTLPTEVEADYRSGLSGIPRISVREESAVRLVHRMTGRTVPLVLDPTLLFTATQWSQVMRPATLDIPTDYVLEIFLDQSSSPERTAIQRAAETGQLHRVNLHDPIREDVWNICPLQFLDLIRRAKLVATDSYHAVVFSIIFNVPFYTRERGNMNSRISSLLGVAGIKPRPLGAFTTMAAADDIEWEAVETRLHKERLRSLDFLRSSL